MEDEQERTLWCGNFSDNMTEEILYELFLQAGPLEKVKIPNDKDGRPRRYGFITFRHAVSVPYTIKLMNGIHIFDRPLKLQARTVNKDANSSGSSFGTPNSSFGSNAQPPNFHRSSSAPDFGQYRVPPNGYGSPQYGSPSGPPSGSSTPEYPQMPENRPQMGRQESYPSGNRSVLGAYNDPSTPPIGNFAGQQFRQSGFDFRPPMPGMSMREQQTQQYGSFGGNSDIQRQRMRIQQQQMLLQQYSQQAQFMQQGPQSGQMQPWQQSNYRKQF